MYPFRPALFALLVIPLAPSAASAQSGGLPPEWEIKKNMEALVSGIAKIKPVLDQIDPKKWVEQGAPDGYVTQHNEAGRTLGYLARSAEALGKKPDKLSQAMDAFFRLQFLEGTLQSLGQGIRRYQNPALGDLMDALVAENTTNREKLRQYMMELAAQKESEFDVIDREAQRCRSSIVGAPQRPPVPKPATTKPAAPKGNE